MADILIDSSIVIDHLRGRSEASRYLDGLRQAGTLATHVVVVAEVLTGARSTQEQQEIDRLFQAFRLYHIQEADSLLSLDLLRQFRLSNGVGWLDCLVAATALRLGLPVATLNDRHFTIFQALTVVRPY